MHQHTPGPTGIYYQQVEPNLGYQMETNTTSNKHNGHNTLGQLKRKTTTTTTTQTMETTHMDNTKGKTQTGH
jgi:hypothetical protein